MPHPFYGFYSRVGDIYTQKSFKLVPPIFIMVFVRGLLPFRNGAKFWYIITMGFTNTSGPIGLISDK